MRRRGSWCLHYKITYKAMRFKDLAAFQTLLLPISIVASRFNEALDGFLSVCNWAASQVYKSRV